MTIKPNNNMSKSQHGLLIFMQDFAITNQCAGELLKCNECTISRYRMGSSDFTMEKLKELKRNYKQYMQKKLDSIKV